MGIDGNPDRKERLIHVVQGNLETSNDVDVVLTTVLGSCIAACLYDSAVGVGGMNHFLLPDNGSSNAGGNSYGVHAMELLINGMLQKGAKKHRIAAKIFGGADMLGIQTSVGKRNIAFVRSFLEMENITCEKESVGGLYARRVRFWPTSGRAQLKVLEDRRDVPIQAEVVRPAKTDIELF